MHALRIGPIERLSSADRSRLEEEFNASKKRTMELASRLNSTNLAAVLPAETLSEIFLHLKRITQRRAGKFKQLDYKGYLTWTLAAGVCVRWRNVMVGTPALWTDIRVLDPTVVRTAIIRSQDMLLDVEVDLQPDQDTFEEARIAHAWRLVLEHSHRIRRLKVDDIYDDADSGPKLVNDVQSAFPELKFLSLSVEQCEDSTMLPRIFRKFCKNPTLKTLEIGFAKFGHSRKFFSFHLQELRLQSVQFNDMTSLESYKTLLGALKELTKLRIFSLIDTVPLDISLTSIYNTCTPSGEFPLILGSAVTLPKLEFMEILLEHSDLDTPFVLLAEALLIRHLILPKSPVLHVHGEVCTPKELGPVIFALKTSLSTPSHTIPVRTLGIYDGKRDSRRHVTVTAWNKELAVLPSHMRSQTQVEPGSNALLFDATIAEFSGKLKLDNIMVHMPYQSIRCLSLYSDRPLSKFFALSSTARTILEAVTRLRILLVEGTWAEKLPEILLRSRSHSLLFPQLRTVYIIGLTVPSPAEEDDATTPHGLWMLQLVDALGSRDGANRLKKIFVKESKGFSREDVRKLQEYADKVIWDEDEDCEDEDKDSEDVYKDEDADGDEDEDADEDEDKDEDEDSE